MANDVVVPKEVLEENARGAWDPLRWVLFAFPWGEKPEFSLVKLPEKWRKRYPNCEYGPDAWACEFLDEIGRQVRANKFDGVRAVPPLMFATASGHGIGKAVGLYEIVPTPHGDKVVKELGVGDYVIGPDGLPTKIVAVPFDGVAPCYRVTFDDGSSTVVSSGHLWTVRGRQERRKGLPTWRTMETIEILRLGVKRKNGKSMARQWEIPRFEGFQCEDKSFRVHPYIVGMAIGNGCLNNTPQLYVSSVEACEHVLDVAKGKVRAIKHENHWQLALNGVLSDFRAIGLTGKCSYEKSIPPEYFLGSFEQRSELLRGLLDSDGEVNAAGTVVYSTVSPQLRDDVVHLVRSLGGKATVQPTPKKGFYKKDGERVYCRDCYRITITMPRGFVFGYYSERTNRIRPKVEERYLSRWIDSIEPVGDLPCRCFTVDREDGLFCVGDFIVTHNSFLTGLLVWWIMCTRPNCKGTITATTMPQLQSKTWAQIAALKKHCILGELFDITSGKGSMKLYAKEAPNAWFCTGQTSKEENSESFAGQHAASSTSFYIFDEASGIPDKIWEVARGGLTDGEPMLFAFGNPTRSSGEFYNAFHNDRDQWTLFKVDSREAQLTNKEAIAGWAKQWGEDSDFFKVRVRGEFPDNASVQFIPTSFVEEAMNCVTPGIQGNAMKRAVLGLDIARFGDDATVLVTRIGRDARSIKWKEFRGLDGRAVGMAVENHCRYLIDELKFQEVRIYFDRAGVGASVWDYFRYELNDFRIRYYPVDFGMKAANSGSYANKRVEMWARMREWLSEGGAIPKNDDLKTELISPEFYFNDRQQMVLERKSDIKDRIGCSPDHADALCLTWADAGADRVGSEVSTPATVRNRFRSDFDPVDVYEREIGGF